MKGIKDVLEKGTPLGTITAFNGKAAKTLEGQGATIHQLVNQRKEEGEKTMMVKNFDNIEAVSEKDLESTEMSVFMLVQDEHVPIPDGIEVVVNYGLETIRTEDNGRVRGNSMYLRGKMSAFVDWLKPFDGIWTTDSPMVGEWKVVHVKKDLGEKK
jgi:hypothetical protein